MTTLQPPSHAPLPSPSYPDSPNGLAAPPPPPAPTAQTNGLPKSGKAKNKKPAGPAPGPAPAAANGGDAHALLLSKISQLEASTTTTLAESAEIDTEVRKANRDLTSLLSTLPPATSKLDTLHRKYSDLLTEMKRVEREHIKAKKRGDVLQKEKEEVGKERTRERGLKEKLEKLSRELTRENKKLKEEVREVREVSGGWNEELQDKLENLVLDVGDVLANPNTAPHSSSDSSVLPLRSRKSPPTGSNSHLVDPQDLDLDALFRARFTSFLHQYELRELSFVSLLRMKDLEIAYQVARHKQLESEAAKSQQLTRQVSTFSQTENELSGQLNVYVEKFKQVEDTLNNSNDLFLTFRKEMEEMSRKTKRLEKENLSLTRKQEATNKNIFQMAEERSEGLLVVERLGRENEKLKRLCRAMQSGGWKRKGEVQPQEGELEGDEVEYDEEGEEYDEDEEEEGDDEEEDDEEEEGEYEDEDTEEEDALGQDQGGVPNAHANGMPAPTQGGQREQMPRTYGPVPPPPPQAQQLQPQQNGAVGKRQVY